METFPGCSSEEKALTHPEGGQPRKKGSWEMNRSLPPSYLCLGKWLSGRLLAETSM